MYVMLRKIKRILIGKPLKNAALKDEKLGILWGTSDPFL